MGREEPQGQAALGKTDRCPETQGGLLSNQVGLHRIMLNQ